MPKVTMLRNLAPVFYRDNSSVAEYADGEKCHVSGETYDVSQKFADLLVQRGLAELVQPLRAVPTKAPIHGVQDESPVSDSNADEAIASIVLMRSKDKLQHIIDNDKRVTVVDAAKKRMSQL